MARAGFGTVLARGTLKLKATPRYVPSEERDALLRAVLTDKVLAGIARLVAGQVAAQIGGAAAGQTGQRQRSFAAYQGLWAGWAAQPQLADGSAWIGNVAAMNQATGPLVSKRGTWRYGAWFNLEWGREWPAKGETYLWQENPGAGNPGPALSRPPGAGPADIEMAKWLRRVARPSGGSQVVGTPLNRAQRAEREVGRKQVIDAHTEASRAHSLDIWERRRLRGPIPQLRAAQTYGRAGFAPIRKGFIGGLSVAEQVVPELLRQALQSIGKAR